MNEVARLNDKERQELFSESASKMGINAAAIEKDFWICWSLMKIFENKDLKSILRFKGGTSLSKCFNLIERFSEDIDLVLDWSLLGLEDIHKVRSRTQQDNFNKYINDLAAEYIKKEFFAAIKAIIEPVCKVKVDEFDGQQINIEYPKSFEDQYIKPIIKLEIGPIATMAPCGEFQISPYCSGIFPRFFTNSNAKVVSILAKRTFWEKITILHAESNSADPKLRYSRHYYDVFKMLGTEVEEEALNDLDLMEDVVRFKKHFYRSTRARYDLAKIGTMKLIPNDKAIKRLSTDYGSMREMIYGDYPEFDLIIEKISAFEGKLNSL